eukprot:scaffold384946_cov32-Prasinocladus_malaysianus.AAC.1
MDAGCCPAQPGGTRESGTNGSRSGNRTRTKDGSRCFRTNAIRRTLLGLGRIGPDTGQNWT